MNKSESLLKKHKIRVTNNRLAVLDRFFKVEKAISSYDIEQSLGDMDRVTLYRTLKMFQEKGVIHKALDSTDTTKYALCIDDCDEHHHHDEHVHFHCQQCQDTICLNDVYVPKVKTPEGFKTSATHMVVEGICSKCV